MMARKETTALMDSVCVQSCRGRPSYTLRRMMAASIAAIDSKILAISRTQYLSMKRPMRFNGRLCRWCEGGSGLETSKAGVRSSCSGSTSASYLAGTGLRRGRPDEVGGRGKADISSLTAFAVQTRVVFRPSSSTSVTSEG